MVTLCPWFEFFPFLELPEPVFLEGLADWLPEGPARTVPTSPFRIWYSGGFGLGLWAD